MTVSVPRFKICSSDLNDIYPLNSAEPVMRPSTSRHIVFTANEGVSLLDLSGPLEAFRVAADFALKERRTSYECTVVSSRGGRVKTANGVELNVKSMRSIANKPIDTLV